MTDKDFTLDPRKLPSWLRERANGHSPKFAIAVYARPAAWLAFADIIESAQAVARPASEYDPSMGPVLWWKFPITEPPYVGAPDDCGMTVEVDIRHYVGGEGEVKTTSARTDVGGWPGYHTHFTLISFPTPPSAEKSGGEK